MTTTPITTRSHRATRRADHEDQITQAQEILANCHDLAIESINAGLVIELNRALQVLNRIHRGSRNVDRATRATNRELHRRRVNRHVQSMAEHAWQIRRQLDASAPTADALDAALQVDYIKRRIDQIGYR